MSETPDLSTLPQRMREAAPVLAEATDRSRKQAGESSEGIDLWCEQDLLEFADRWEAQDRVNAERDAVVEELAQALDAVTESSLEYNRATARILIDQGWRKGDHPSPGLFDGIGRGGPW